MAETGSRALARLAEQAWEETMRESPEYATMLGDHRYDDRDAPPPRRDDRYDERDAPPPRGGR